MLPHLRAVCVCCFTHFFLQEGDASILLRMKEDYDGAEPAASSIALANLWRLAGLTSGEVCLPLPLLGAFYWTLLCAAQSRAACAPGRVCCMPLHRVIARLMPAGCHGH